LSQRIEPALQGRREIAPLVPCDRRVLTEASSFSPKPLFVSRRLDRYERCPFGLALILGWQELAAQSKLLFSTGSVGMPYTHVTKAGRMWWPVGVKVGSGCRDQELGDGIHCRDRPIRCIAGGGSRAAGRED